MSHDFGVSDDDVTALIAATAGREHGLGEVETAVLAAAREITADTRMTDETWAALLGHLGRARLVDLVIVISFYNAVIRILATLQIDVEPDYERYLGAFPLAERAPGPETARRPG